MFFERINLKKVIYAIVLIIYLIIVLYMTLIGRTHTDSLSAVLSGWLPFKRYDGTWNIDAIYNIFLLTPITFLLNRIFPITKKRKLVKKAIIVSLLISSFIEINQLIFEIGTFQIADLGYNTISVGIGGILSL